MKLDIESLAGYPSSMRRTLFTSLTIIACLGLASLLRHRKRTVRVEADPRVQAHRADDSEEGLRWEPNLETAMRKARKNGRAIFITFCANELGQSHSPFY